jgi:hypothetical protein
MDQNAKIRAEREKTYGSPAESMTNTGLAWTALIQENYQIQLPHPIPAHVVALMMTQLKLARAAKPFETDNDSYVDAHNYLDFAEETATNIPEDDKRYPPQKGVLDVLRSTGPSSLDDEAS